MQSNTTLVGLFIKQCFYLYFKPHVSAYASEPSSGLFQELTHTDNENTYVTVFCMSDGVV
jgi:hypothetical protein